MNENCLFSTTFEDMHHKVLHVFTCSRMEYSRTVNEYRIGRVLCTKAEKAGGVISASAGNQALALAYQGHDLNVPITVVMPQITPLMKIELCRQFGATIIIHGDSFFEVGNGEGF